MIKKTLLAMISCAVIFANITIAKAEETYKWAWSHYTGWEVMQYIADSGIMDKWNKKYGTNVEVVLVNDYIESINMYTAGQFAACTMTNMDALTIPAVGGLDSTVLIVGDFSNGNDGIVLLNGESVTDLKGRKLRIVELSVSHYLLTRALDMNGMTERDLTIVNTSDADIAGIFISECEKDPKAAVCTWNPQLMSVRQVKNTNLVFDSSKIPGEIIDATVARSDLPEPVKKAMAGAWYEAMQIMSEKSKRGQEALQIMAKSAGGTMKEFNRQLKTTAMFYDPAKAVEFVNGQKLKDTMEYVRTFSFDHGLYGDGSPDKDLVGIEFPDKTIMGDTNNVKLRFTDKYMKMATEGQL